MEFNLDWLTLGRHRVRLRSTQGFPIETMRSVAELVRLAIDNNMSARARLVEIVLQHRSGRGTPDSPVAFAFAFVAPADFPADRDRP